MDIKDINLKLDRLVDAISHEIDGKCYAYMSRFNCEWYYHLSIDFEFSNLHVNISISEETMTATQLEVIIQQCLDGIKAEIISNYFK